MRTQISQDTLHAAGNETADGQGPAHWSKSAKSLDLVADVAGVTGPGVDIVLETTFNEVDYVEIARISGITVAGIFTATVERGSVAIGIKCRASWELAGGTCDFEARLVRKD